jgi:DNA-binding XRE family transcriptional regulator
MGKRTSWDDIKAQRLLSEEGRAAYEDEARISAFRALVHRLRTEAGLTQADLAGRMGTTQSAIARMEGGGPARASRPSSVSPPPSGPSSWSGWARTSRTTAASPSWCAMATPSSAGPAERPGPVTGGDATG